MQKMQQNQKHTFISMTSHNQPSEITITKHEHQYSITPMPLMGPRQDVGGLDYTTFTLVNNNKEVVSDYLRQQTSCGTSHK